MLKSCWHLTFDRKINPMPDLYELNIQLRISLGQFMTYEIRVETSFSNKAHFYGKCEKWHANRAERWRKKKMKLLYKILFVILSGMAEQGSKWCVCMRALKSFWFNAFSVVTFDLYLFFACLKVRPIWHFITDKFSTECSLNRSTWQWFHFICPLFRFNEMPTQRFRQFLHGI